MSRENNQSNSAGRKTAILSFVGVPFFFISLFLSFSIFLCFLCFFVCLVFFSFELYKSSQD